MLAASALSTATNVQDPASAGAGTWVTTSATSTAAMSMIRRMAFPRKITTSQLVQQSRYSPLYEQPGPAGLFPRARVRPDVVAGIRFTFIREHFEHGRRTR